MKYKKGDKVKIKTWEAMVEEYGLKEGARSIPCKCSFNLSMETKLKELNCNRILTIKKIMSDARYHESYYYVVEMNWDFSDDMIEGLATIEKQINNEQKTFRDLLGRDIKVGDNVLHLWTRLDNRGYPKGGAGGVGKKLATVINQTPKGVGIEWRDSHDKRRIKRSNIKNTRNRLIILDGKKLSLEIDDIVKDVEEAHDKYKKSTTTRRRNLNTKLAFEREMNGVLAEKNRELQEAIKMLTNGSERFSLLDL
jgi:hypothetical protein